MRNLSEVINKILREIPESNQKFINELKNNLSSVSCAAPKLIPMWWNEVYATIQGNIPEKLNKEWHFKILSIFSIKPIEEIKEYFK
jgi:hypothetical protein